LLLFFHLIQRRLTVDASSTARQHLFEPVVLVVAGAPRPFAKALRHHVGHGSGAVHARHGPRRRRRGCWRVANIWAHEKVRNALLVPLFPPRTIEAHSRGVWPHRCSYGGTRRVVAD